MENPMNNNLDKSMLELTKDNKNLLRVAMEIAGHGDRTGDDSITDQIAVKSSGEILRSDQKFPVMDNYGRMDAFADFIIEHLHNLEETLDFELQDSDLDFAINSIIDNLSDLQEEESDSLTVHVNGKGIPSGAVRSDTIPTNLKRDLPPNHSAVDPGHIGRKGVTVVSWQAPSGGKNKHHIAAVMPDEEAKKMNRQLRVTMRASGHLD